MSDSFDTFVFDLWQSTRFFHFGKKHAVTNMPCHRSSATDHRVLGNFLHSLLTDFIHDISNGTLHILVN